MSRKLDEKDYILTIDYKLEGEEWQKFIDKAKQSLLANVVVPGYRKGKAPLRESLKRISEFEILDKRVNIYNDRDFIRRFLEFKEKEQ